MGIYVNRILNLKKIEAIGFDMDHTLVRYDSQKFEYLTFKELIRKLIATKNYPDEIATTPFNYHKAIRGLVIDKQNGNLVKLSLYGRVKLAFHGFTQLDYKAMNQHYRGMVIDLNDPDYRCIDTTFSIAEAILFSSLVEFKNRNPDLALPSFEVLAEDILEALDMSHRDGSLKSHVLQNLEDYVIKDPLVPEVLENFKLSGKSLIVITNSDFHYTKALLDFTFNPFLKNHRSWMELFDWVITCAEKPSFFTQQKRFLKVNPLDGTMTNVEGPLTKGIYQGGSATQLQKTLNMTGEEILYIGDHIYGDILQLKKVCNWRTALVMEEIGEEIASLKEARLIISQIDGLMEEKEKLEKRVNEFSSTPSPDMKKDIEEGFKTMKGVDDQLSQLIQKYQTYFNSHWGEVMRAGQEESRFMGQVAKYACIYMGKISDFKAYSPFHYFRPKKRPLPHEVDL